MPCKVKRDILADTAQIADFFQIRIELLFAYFFKSICGTFNNGTFTDV